MTEESFSKFQFFFGNWKFHFQEWKLEVKNQGCHFLENWFVKPGVFTPPRGTISAQIAIFRGVTPNNKIGHFFFLPAFGFGGGRFIALGALGAAAASAALHRIQPSMAPLGR